MIAANVKGLIGLIVLGVFGISTSGQTPVLKNRELTAQFGPRGLTALTDSWSGATVRFSEDEFGLMVDGESLNGSQLQPAVKSEKQSVVYSFRDHGYSIQVSYELHDDWKFLTKRLEILDGPSSQYHIERVEPLRLALDEPIRGTFIPQAYAPQFGARAEGVRRLPTKQFGEFLRLDHGIGVMLVVQNPFLDVARNGQQTTLRYEPEMTWQKEWGAWSSDLAVIGLYQQSGERIPAEMIYEWNPSDGTPRADGADQNEVRAFSDCVRKFLLSPSEKPIRVEVGWTLNDYQIDVATPEGRAEYKRVMDTASSLGIDTLLYAPANSELADRANDADDWDWEHVLWLGLGQRIRAGKWDVEKGTIPSSVTEMLDYARSKKIGLLAYVYPSLPFVGNSNWLVTNPAKREKNSATLSSREFQDFLIRELLAFQRRTGIRGYSFDYAFLNLPGSSPYSQWWGWRRVLESLRKAKPDIVIDGRQSYQLYGPWSWLAGSYPHPTGNDEQAESFTPYPDLHFDRVSGDRVRFVNYWYRNYQFAPEEIIPGYMTHQTPRNRNVRAADNGPNSFTAEPVYTSFRARDWDYLGFRYSILSSIATGGWNNVFSMLPGRDLAEFQNFAESDKAWISDWLAWTVANKEFLRNTKTILSQPAMDRVDGTSTLVRDRGFLFLFNPNYKALPAIFRLDERIGLEEGSEFLLREIYPERGKLIGNLDRGIWKRGDEVHLDLDGTSAIVLEVIPNSKTEDKIRVFNATSMDPKVPLDAKVEDGVLRIEHIAGEPGTIVKLGVLLPEEGGLRGVMVNGKPVEFQQADRYVSANVQFAGERFAHAQEIPLNADSDGVLTGSFVIPPRIAAQLANRRKQWPIPWTPQDYETTWLVPERLLLFLQFAEPSESTPVAVQLDDSSLDVKRAYSSVRENRGSFVGFYVDLSHVQPGVPHRIHLTLAKSDRNRFRGIFFDNVETEFTEQLAP